MEICHDCGGEIDLVDDTICNNCFMNETNEDYEEMYEEAFGTPWHLLMNQKWLDETCKKCGFRNGDHPLRSDECPKKEVIS